MSLARTATLMTACDQTRSLHVPILKHSHGFPGGVVVKNPPANAGDMGSSPGPGRSHTLRSN